MSIDDQKISERCSGSIKFFLVLCIVIVVGCAQQQQLSLPIFPPQKTRMTLASRVQSIRCKSSKGFFSSAFMTSNDGLRKFYVIFRVLPMRPYKRVAIFVEEFDGDGDFLHAWIDKDGDENPEEYFSNIKQLREKHVNACDILQ